MNVVRLSALRTVRLYPPPLRKYAWHSRLLEAESTPGPQCGRKDYNNEKLQRPKKLIVTITDMASRHRSVTVM